MVYLIIVEQISLHSGCAAEGKASRYYNWFYYLPETIQYADPPDYEAFAYVKEMPKLNTGNPEVVEYLLQCWNLLDSGSRH